MTRIACIVLLALALMLGGCDEPPEDNGHPQDCYINSWTGKVVCP